MVFIGDENGEFLEVLLTIGKDDLLSVNDLIKQHKTNIYIETIGRVYQCIKYTCKSWSYDVSYQSSPGCTAIVGKPCEIFSLMKKKIVAAINIFRYICHNNKSNNQYTNKNTSIFKHIYFLHKSHTSNVS